MSSVHFYDLHAGRAGAGVPLPRCAREIAERYCDGDGDPAELVRELREAYPDGEVRDVPPGTGFAILGPIDFGMITLVCPATGYPRSCWRVLKYRPTTTPGTPGGS